MLVFGLFQFGWFVKLNASNRNCSLCRSVNLKSLCIEKSRPMMPGESGVPRPTFPKVPAWAKMNVLVSKKRCGSCCPRGSAAFWPVELGRSKSAPVLDVSRPFVTVAFAVDGDRDPFRFHAVLQHDGPAARFLVAIGPAGGTACPTLLDQSFAKQVGQAVSPAWWKLISIAHSKSRKRLGALCGSGVFGASPGLTPAFHPVTVKVSNYLALSRHDLCPSEFFRATPGVIYGPSVDWFSSPYCGPVPRATGW